MSTMIWGLVATGKGISLVGVALPVVNLVAEREHALRPITRTKATAIILKQDRADGERMGRDLSERISILSDTDGWRFTHMRSNGRHAEHAWAVWPNG